MTPRLLPSLAFAISLTALVRAGPAPTLDTIQVKYSDPTDGNVVLVTWERTAAGSAPASILVDGTAALSVTSSQGFNIAEVTQVQEGQHLFEVIEGGTVQVGFLSQEVLSFPPIGDVVSLECIVDEDDCEIIVSGDTGGPPSSYVEVIIDGVLQAQQLKWGDFNQTRQVFEFRGTFPLETSGQHQVIAYAVGERGDGSFENGSYRQDETTSCSSDCGTGGSVSFVPGLCNGVGTGPSGRQPDISSAVFGLSWLFSGTRAPPCAAACDANGDGGVDISDMVSILNYLFSGGPAPDGWVDSSGDGVADPTCKLPGAGDDCAAGHDACGG